MAQTVIIREADIIEWLVCRAADISQKIKDNLVIKLPVENELEDIRKSKRGDHEAFRRLVELHQNYISKIMWRFSRNKQVHEELVQDVFVQAYISLHNYQPKSPFSHWLARIATRTGYGYWKKAAQTKQHEPLTLEEWDKLTAEENVGSITESAELMHKLLEQLPPRDRIVLTLRYLEECDVTETAQRIGWTKTMVKVQTLRAKSKLKKLFIENRRKLQ